LESAKLQLALAGRGVPERAVEAEIVVVEAPKPKSEPVVEVAKIVEPAAAKAPPVDDARAWRERAETALKDYQRARDAELFALVREQERLEASTREAEARLERLRAEKAEATTALQRRNTEPSPRVYLSRDWATLTDDKTLRGVLTRWSSIEQVPLNWTAPWDYPVLGNKAVRGDLPTALEELMRELPAGDARLKALLDAGKGLTITEEAKP
jgi:hypothetical protein